MTWTITFTSQWTAARRGSKSRRIALQGRSCRGINSIGFGVFAVNPANPQNIVAGNMALYRTNNEGLTWTEIGHWWGIPIRRLHPPRPKSDRLLANGSLA